MAFDKHQITGLILAGGRGERMDGADKGWIDYRGRPLIAHAVERLAPQVQCILISANRNIERYGEMAEVVTDADAKVATEEYAGPLIGVLAGVQRARTDWIAIVPCDAPHFPHDLVQRLVHAASDARTVASCARAGGALQPVFAIVRHSTAQSLAVAISSGERAMHRWLTSLHAVPVDFDDADAFANINTPPGGMQRVGSN